MLDVEVAVAALRERDLREPALHRLTLVAELVRGVDPETGDEADRDGEAHAVEGREVAAHQEREGHEEPGVLQREEEERDPAVVAVCLERVDDGVRGVAGIEADHEVEQGDQAEDDEWPDPQPDAQAGGGEAGDGHERKKRHEERDGPQVALAVAPRHGRTCF